MSLKDALANQGELKITVDDSTGSFLWNGAGMDYFVSNVCGCTPSHAVDAFAVLKKIGDMWANIFDLQAAVHRLYAGPRCCGSEWRNKAGRLYMHHGKGDNCPLHGKAAADADRGLRSYVGQEDEADMLAAAANYELWQTKQAELRRLTNSFHYLEMQLKSLGK